MFYAELIDAFDESAVDEPRLELLRDFFNTPLIKRQPQTQEDRLMVA
jgi:hypothetical protein